MAKMGRLIPPTSCLPKLSMLATCSLEQLTQALDNLRTLYCRAPTPPLSLALPAKHLPKHLIHDVSAPDSGYASAEEEDVDEEFVEETCVNDGPDPDVLRSDADRKSTSLNSSHSGESRMPSSA